MGDEFQPIKKNTAFVTCTTQLWAGPDNNMGFRWAVKMQAHLNFRPITTLHCFPPPSIRPPTRRQLMLPVLSADLRRAPTPFSLLPLALAPPPPPPPTLLRRRPLLLPRAISSSTSPPPVQEMEAAYKFGPYKIDAREVFHSTPLSYAMVNLRPLLPGNNLLTPPCSVLPLDRFTLSNRLQSPLFSTTVQSQNL